MLLVVQNFFSSFQTLVWWYISVSGTRVFLYILYLGRHVSHHLLECSLVVGCFFYLCVFVYLVHGKVYLVFGKMYLVSGIMKFPLSFQNVFGWWVGTSTHVYLCIWFLGMCIWYFGEIPIMFSECGWLVGWCFWHSWLSIQFTANQIVTAPLAR